MRISHKRKFVFIAITKTASSSIRKVISKDNYIDLFPGDLEENVSPHVTASELKKIFIKMNWDWNEYFKFAFVRNPWDRIVSQWAFQLKHIKEAEYNNTCSDFMLKVKAGGFKNFIKHLSRFHKTAEHQFRETGRFRGDGKGPLYLNQLDWILDENGNNLLDFIGKVENLREDFDIICDKIGIPQQQLPHKNPTSHKHYTEYYDDETREIVAEKYAKDIEYFGYKFGE